MRDRLTALGWSEIEVIDDDLGRSAAGGIQRAGFERMVAQVPVREDDPTVPASPYGSSKLMTEIMLRDAGAAHGLQHVILRYFKSRVPTRWAAPASRPKGPPTSSRSRSKPRSDGGRRWMCSVPTTRRRTEPASEIISMFPISSPPSAAGQSPMAVLPNIAAETIEGDAADNEAGYESGSDPFQRRAFLVLCHDALPVIRLAFLSAISARCFHWSAILCQSSL
jgi:hypothetical protein